MALLFKSDIERDNDWRAAFARHLPDLKVRLWPDVGDPDDIEYALMWKPERGELARYSNLKVIFSVGAGVDHLASDPELPRHIPLVRMVEPGLTAGMVEYVLFGVLYLHRFLFDYAAMARERAWREIPQVAATERRVGIMGFGHLGQAAAEPLVALGFPVAGWSRSPKALPGVQSFHGTDGFGPFLARSDILVLLLPLTAETEDIVDARTLALLPKGAGIVSAGRGRQVVEENLLAALDSGQVGGAVLDVFRQEPLPAEHRFWSHPRVLVTPHIASMTNVETAASTIAANIRRFEAGQPLTDVVDPARGY